MTESASIGELAQVLTHQLIAARFEHPDIPHRLFYHDTGHTNKVWSRAAKIGAAIGLSQREMLLVGIAARFHDTQQAWTLETWADGRILRKRKPGESEAASAREAASFMSGSDGDFTPEEIEVVKSAIMATVPGWSFEHRTAIQPLLSPTTHPVARAVALADLGAAGMDTEDFVQGGCLMFAENEVDIVQTLRDAKHLHDIDPRTQRTYQDRLIGWFDMQPDFARGRQRALEEELQGLTQARKKYVKQLFGRFNASIRAAEQVASTSRELAFATLMWNIYPNAFQNTRH